MMKRIGRGTAALLIMATAMAVGVGAAADVAAQLDRQQVAVGDALTLTLRARAESLAEQPDLSPLESAFHVLGVSRAFRTTIVNGRRDDVAEWLVTLMPRTAGDTEVPAIAVGALKTNPIPLSVVASVTSIASQPPASTVPRDPHGSDPRADPGPPPVRLSARVDEPAPYVQEQVVLTLRLESAVPIIDGQMTEPSVPGALVERLGEDVHGSSDVDGRTVNWIERSYAIHPQQSGRLEIDSVGFEGTTPIRASASKRSRGVRGRHGGGLRSRLDALMGSSVFDDPFFDDAFMSGSTSLFDRAFGPRGQAVRAGSSPIALDVKPRPSDAVGSRWLPARDVKLVEVWGEGQSEPSSLRVGEPIDRVVAIRAHGVTATQLPAPVLSEPDGFKQYANPAYTDTQDTNGDLVAIHALPTTLIPTRAGELTLPPVEIAWWDTEADAPRTTTLPGRTVTVLPGDDTGLAAAAVTPPSPLADDAGHADGSAPASLAPAASDTSSNAVFYAVLALSIGLSGAAIGWATLRRGGPTSRERDATPAGAWARRRARTGGERALARACRSGDAVAAELALIAIGCATLPDPAPTSATAVAHALGDGDLEREVALLLSSRYAARGAARGAAHGAAEHAANQSKWTGERLWAAWRRCRRSTGHKAHTANDSALPALYPSTAND